jgi:glutathionyl-hydroquinone reductase
MGFPHSYLPKAQRTGARHLSLRGRSLHGRERLDLREKHGCIPDPIFNARYLYEIYIKADPRYTGRVTVPVLWDKQRGTIVNNESAEIIRMLNSEFDA